MKKRKKAYQLKRFFVVSFLWSWCFWVPLALAGVGIIPLSLEIMGKITIPVSVLAALGPGVGALAAISREKDSLSPAAYLKSFLSLRFGWRGFLYPWLILGGITFIAWILPELFGQERLPMLLPNIWIFPLYLLIMLFLGGGQEELGWRGYAMPRMEEKFGLWSANLYLGILWAFWHLPLWFIPQTSQTFMNFGGFILLTIGYSYLFSWFYQISGRRAFSGLYVHGIANAVVPLMPILINVKAVPQPRFWLWVSLTFAAGILVTWLRLKNEPKPEK